MHVSMMEFQNLPDERQPHTNTLLLPARAIGLNQRLPDNILMFGSYAAPFILNFERNNRLPGTA